MTVPKNKIRALGRLLNAGKSHGANARLSDWTGASLATVKGWQIEGAEEQRRPMSRSSQRLLAVLAYLYAQRALDDEVMEKIKAIEAHMLAGKGKLVEFLETMTSNNLRSDDDE